MIIRKKLDAVQANASIRAYYHNYLLDLINKMILDMNNAIIKNYKKRQDDIIVSNIIHDASPANDLNSIINKITNKWVKVFSEHSKPLADKVFNKSNEYYTKRLNDMLKKYIKNISIKLDKSTLDVIRLKRANVIANVELIKSIPIQYKNRVLQATMQSITKGYDLKTLTDSLVSIGGITRNRAKLIARDQTSKINSDIQHTKWDNVGIKTAFWRHSSAGKTYRILHVRANGKIYDIKKGLLIDNEYIFPSQLIDCKCTGEPVLELEI